jgi:hypothetical protein
VPNIDRTSDWAEDEDTFKILSDEFFSDTTTHTRGAQRVAFPSPPFALLPGLEDLRETFYQALVDLISEKGWKGKFEIVSHDEPAGMALIRQNKNREEGGPVRLPFEVHRLLGELKHIEDGDAEWDDLRTCLGKLHADSVGVSFFNDGYADPIVIA